MRSRSLIRRLALALTVTAAFTASAASASPYPSYPDPMGYCVGANHQYDPHDLGSIPLDPLPTGVSERFVTLGGIRTPLLEAGSGSSPISVVFVHGNIGSSRDFVDMMSAARTFGLRLLAFDLPGAGRAEHPWWFPYTEDSVVAWLSDALEQLGAHHVILVVHDFGGPIGMQWAAEHRQQFLGAAIVDSGVLIGFQDHYLSAISKTPLAGEAFMAGITKSTFSLGAMYGQQKPLPLEYVAREYAEFDRPMRCGVISMYRSVGNFDALGRAQAAALRPLDRPATVIWGGNDPYVQLPVAYNQKYAFPHDQLHIFPNDGHWPFEDDPKPVTDLVASFLSRWESQAARSVARSRRAHRHHHRNKRGRHGRSTRRR